MGDSAAGGVEMLKRDISPANFIFMIRSFSLLSETENEKHESGSFQACDKKWKLCVYPKGKKQQQQQADNEDAHISLYLQIVDTHNFPLGWVVHAKFSLFVYNHVEDKYFTLKDSGGEKVRRFHYMKTEWGFDQLLPLSIFNDPSNGYLVDDTCAFGAEIVVVSNATKGECLSLVKDPENKKYTWRISNFASKQREQQVIYSDEFTIEGSTWKLQVFPKGDSSAKDKNLSLFLESVDSSNLTVNNGRKLYAKYKLRICNQLKPGEDQEKEATCVFGGSPAVTRWGYYYFLLLNQLESVAKGFLLNDTLIVEVEFMSLTKFSEF